jgi:hypothetical protein
LVAVMVACGMLAPLELETKPNSEPLLASDWGQAAASARKKKALLLTGDMGTSE